MWGFSCVVWVGCVPLWEWIPQVGQFHWEWIDNACRTKNISKCYYIIVNRRSNSFNLQNLKGVWNNDGIENNFYSNRYTKNKW